jgi:hypothetical protein
LELSRNSSVFLKKGKKLIQLNKPGLYEINSLFNRKALRLSDALSFLKQLREPRLYTTNALVRGNKEGKPVTDADYFETLWEKIVAESDEKVSRVPASDLLAAASWFNQQGNKVRVAYILERLSGQKAGENEFYRQMRLESFRGIRLVEINRELETTKQRISANTATLHYKALLIGINNYDHPAWQRLKNPISDVRALKQVLVNHFKFNPMDVLVLEDAGYDDIVNAFNKLKQFTGDNSNLLVYYAGHGFYPQDEGEGYWIPKDAGEPESLRLFLPTSIVLGKINSIKTKHTLLIADSCFSGSLIRKTRGVESNSRFYQDLSRKKSRQIITSGGLEPVDDQGAGDHSIFAGKLLKILKEDRQEPLSASELAFNLRKEVKDAWGNQTPEYGRLQIKDDENGEFFFVQLKEAEQKEPEPQVAATPPVPVPVVKAPASKVYSYDNLPRGACLAPKAFTDLRKCSFHNKKIEDLNLEGANLEGVDFRYVQLEDADFRGANLRNTDWRYSIIDGLTASDSFAKDSDWRFTRIQDSDYSNSDLRESDFRYTYLDDILFDYANMAEADIRYSSMSDVSMKGTNLIDVRTTSNELFSDRIKGIIQGIGGAIDGLKKNDEVEEEQENSPTSSDNRKTSYVYLGLKPFSASAPESDMRPLNLGFYLGSKMQLGFEVGMIRAADSASTFDAEASIVNKGMYLRIFPSGSFNVMFGLNQWVWTGEATANMASNSAAGMLVEETETAYLATFAIGNQWLLDSGITIGADWAILSGKPKDSTTTRDVTDKGGSTAETAEADQELNNLEEKLGKELLFSDKAHYLTLSLGFSF